jgi:tetrahydromethanopterin S-methyltransferase subunit A
MENSMEEKKVNDVDVTKERIDWIEMQVQMRERRDDLVSHYRSGVLMGIVCGIWVSLLVVTIVKRFRKGVE